jgi:uncharacterized protein
VGRFKGVSPSIYGASGIFMLTLKVTPWHLSLAQLPHGSDCDWAKSSAFYTISQTAEELSVVCETSLIPQSIKQQKNWRAFYIDGVLDFSLVGILAKISSILAAAEISIFAISTYNTDYILIKEEKLEPAIEVLRGKGYQIIAPDLAKSGELK